jgi:hypothetical protein
MVVPIGIVLLTEEVAAIYEDSQPGSDTQSDQ